MAFYFAVPVEQGICLALSRWCAVVVCQNEGLAVLISSRNFLMYWVIVRITVFYHPVPGKDFWNLVPDESPVQQLWTTFFLTLFVFPYWMNLWWTNLIWLAQKRAIPPLFRGRDLVQQHLPASRVYVFVKKECLKIKILIRSQFSGENPCLRVAAKRYVPL